MGGTLMQPCRVCEEGLRVVKHFQRGEERMIPAEEAPADSVPAAAVIRRVQALIGITGRKGHAGGLISRM